MILRYYQQELVNKVRSAFMRSKRVIMCLPTGGGKTVCFAYIAKQTTKKTLILTDRVELLERTKQTLTECGVECDTVQQSTKVYTGESKITLSMVETFSRRYKSKIQDFDFIIIDEAHKKNFDKIIDLAKPETYILGVTATPLPTKKYDTIVETVTTTQLIEQGFLSSPECFGVDVDLEGVASRGGDYDPNSIAQRYEEKKVYIGVADNLERLSKGKKTLLFAPNVEASINVCKELLARGFEARHFDATSSSTDRKNTLEWFRKTNGVLCNVGLCTTGFDLPEIETVVLYRATKSLALFMQMVGRGARTTQYKKTFQVLDFGNNFKRFGFWENSREWTLEVVKRPKGEPPVKLCKTCGAMNKTTAKFCWYCQDEFKVKPPTIKKVTLKKLVNTSQRESIWTKIKREAKTKEDVMMIIQSYGYKPSFYYKNRLYLRKYV